MNREALIVEDDPITGELLRDILLRKGYQPTLFGEGKPAVPWTREHHPQLILLDLGLPDVDGNDICEELKFDRETNLIPIIMVTGRTREEDRVRGLQVGANDYLTKPFTGAQLDRAIEQTLAWRDRLESHGTAGEIRFQLQSDTCYLEELNRLLGSLLRHTCLTSAQVRQLITAVREMGTNAIEWGHHKQVERIVTVTYVIEADKVIITIRDTGPGFDPRKLPHAARADDPISHTEVREKLGLREGGFGIMMTHGMVDELAYNETGNEVRLVKHCPPHCTNTPAQTPAADA